VAFVLLTFCLAFLIIAGAYWLVVMRAEGREGREVKKRLRGAGRGSKAQVGLERERKRLSSVPLLDRFFARSQRIGGKLQLFLDSTGVDMTVGRFLAMSAFAGAALFGLINYLTALWPLAIAAGILASVVPYLALRVARTSRMRKFEEQFPEAIDLIARALRAGHAFTTGVNMAGQEVPDPVGAEFRLLYEHQNYGMSLPDALRRFAERIPLLDARFFATAVLTQRESGGNLAEVLDNLAAVIRERFRVKRQVRVISAHGRITGWVLVAFPPALALAFSIMSPGSMQVLVTDPIGIRMAIGAIILQIIGTLVIRKLVDVEY